MSWIFVLPNPIKLVWSITGRYIYSPKMTTIIAFIQKIMNLTPGKRSKTPLIYKSKYVFKDWHRIAMQSFWVQLDHLLKMTRGNTKMHINNSVKFLDAAQKGSYSGWSYINISPLSAPADITISRKFLKSMISYIWSFPLSISWRPFFSFPIFFLRSISQNISPFIL